MDGFKQILLDKSEKMRQEMEVSCLFVDTDPRMAKSFGFALDGSMQPSAL